MNEWFELRRSPIQGLGAFAITDVPKGTRLIEYSGERISNAEADRRYDDEAMGRHLCALHPGQEVRLDLQCKTVDGKGERWGGADLCKFPEL